MKQTFLYQFNLHSTRTGKVNHHWLIQPEQYFQMKYFHIAYRYGFSVWGLLIITTYHPLSYINYSFCTNGQYLLVDPSLIEFTFSPTAYYSPQRLLICVTVDHIENYFFAKLFTTHHCITSHQLVPKKKNAATYDILWKEQNKSTLLLVYIPHLHHQINMAWRIIYKIMSFSFDSP